MKHPANNLLARDDLGADESATILVKSNTTSYETYAVYPGGILKLPIRDDIYSVDVYLVNNETILGGYTGTLQVTKRDIDQSSGITFHVVWQESASEDDRALFVGTLGDYSKKVPAPQLG